MSRASALLAWRAIATAERLRPIQYFFSMTITWLCKREHEHLSVTGRLRNTQVMDRI